MDGGNGNLLQIMIILQLQLFRARLKPSTETGASRRVPLAPFPVHSDESFAPRDGTLLPVDVDVPLYRVTPAPPGHASDGGETRPLAAPLRFAHLVEDVHVVGQPVLLAPQRLALDLGKRRVLSARHHASGVARLAHSAQPLRVALGEVEQAVLDAGDAVHETGAIAAVWFAALLPVVVDVAGDLVRRAPGQKPYRRGGRRYISHCWPSPCRLLNRAFSSTHTLLYVHASSQGPFASTSLFIGNRYYVFRGGRHKDTVSNENRVQVN